MTSSPDCLTVYTVDDLLTDRQYAAFSDRFDIRIEIQYPITECRCAGGHHLRLVAISAADDYLPHRERLIGAALKPGLGFCSADAHHLDTAWLAVPGADIRLTAHADIVDPAVIAICLGDAAAILNSPGSSALRVSTTVVAVRPTEHPSLPPPLRTINARYVSADLTRLPKQTNPAVNKEKL